MELDGLFLFLVVNKLILSFFAISIWALACLRSAAALQGLNYKETPEGERTSESTTGLPSTSPPPNSSALLPCLGQHAWSSLACFCTDLGHSLLTFFLPLIIITYHACTITLHPAPHTPSSVPLCRISLPLLLCPGGNLQSLSPCLP